MSIGTSNDRLLTAIRLAMAVVVVGLTLSLGPVQVAHAAKSFTVDTLLDAGDASPGDGLCDNGIGRCSLRAAIQETNALPGHDIITLPAGTYVLTAIGSGENLAVSGDLDVTDNLTINGAGADVTIIDGGDLELVSVFPESVFHLLGNASSSGGSDQTTVNISDVTIRNGGAGAISASNGDLTLTDIILTDNEDNSGGGLAIIDPGQTVRLVNSTVSNNTATTGAGGGIFNQGTLELVNSTVSGNTAAGDGGGIYTVNGSTTLNNVTITNNTADSDNDGSGKGGGIVGSIVPGTVTFSNTIIGANAGATDTDCWGALTSRGYNLIQAVTPDCTIEGDTSDNLTGIDPFLGPLQDNGGPTPTHAPNRGSPVIEAGSPALVGGSGNACEPRDQRNLPRWGHRCDIGAVESRSILWVNSPADAHDPSPGDGKCGNFPDPGAACTLRAAVEEANANPGFDIIVVGGDLRGYTLTLGELAVTDNLIIYGLTPDSTVIDGGGLGRVFHVMTDPSGPSFVNLIISNVTIQNGDAGSGRGGGIYLEHQSGSALQLTNSIVSGNSAADGGGIAINDTGRIVLMSDSTISGNTATADGGGIYTLGDLESVNNTTISGNTSGQHGGGIYVANDALARLTNLTITGNTAGGDGGGVNNALTGLVALNNTILAGNSDTGGEAPDCSGLLRSTTYNLLGDDTGCTFAATIGDQVGTGGSPIDPLLDPNLQNNGGLTPTHTLLFGSPAIDAGDPAAPGTCETTDQRGNFRPVDADADGNAVCDVGAVEVENTPAGTGTVARPLLPDGSSPVEVTFAGVSEAGDTTLTLHDCTPTPSGFGLGSPPVCYDVTTTATYTPPVQVCIDYSGTSLDTNGAAEVGLRLFHYESGTPVDVTLPGYPDTTNNIICGEVTSLSPFGVFVPLNQPPSAEAGGPYSVGEGGTVALAGSGSDPDGDPLTFAWDLDNNGSYETPGQNPIFSAAGRDGPDSQTVVLQVCDDSNACATDAATIVIENIAPSVDVGANVTIFSGETLTVSATFTDPGTADTHTASIDFGAGDGPQGATVDQGAGSVTGSHRYFMPGTYAVEVCVTDDDGGTGCDTLTLEVVPLPVSIDVNPDAINCNNDKGVLRVAILSSAEFDATTVDPNTVRFGPAGAQETHRDRDDNARVHIEDVDGDGLDDLVLHFRYGETGLTCEDTSASLTGQTSGNVFLVGTDGISNNPAQGPKDSPGKGNGGGRDGS